MRTSENSFSTTFVYEGKKDVHPKVEDLPPCTSVPCLPRVETQECNFTEPEVRTW